MQILQTENDVENQTQRRSTCQVIVAQLPNIMIGVIALLQIVTIILFAYTFTKLLTIQAQIQPAVNSFTTVNFTQITDTISDGKNIIADFKTQYHTIMPIIKKLPYFFEQTELFMDEVRQNIEPPFKILNFTNIADAVNISQSIYEELKPQYYKIIKPSLSKLPEFINNTESFINEVRKVLQPFITNNTRV